MLPGNESMETTSKRAKVGTNLQVLDDVSKTGDSLSKGLSPTSALFQNLTTLLESPFDWHFLRAASTQQQHVGKVLWTCAGKFKSELNGWDGAKIMEEASKELPDGDRILFATCIKRFLYENASSAEQILQALLLLLRNGTVGGWPPAPYKGIDFLRP